MSGVLKNAPEIFQKKWIYPNFLIKIMKEEDKESAVKFIRRTFFVNEPICQYCNITQNAELEEYCTSCIKDGLSMMVTPPENENEIIGLQTNESFDLSGHNHENGNAQSNSVAEKISRLFDKVAEEARKTKEFGSPNVKEIYMKVVAVDNAWLRKGIAKELGEKTRELARMYGYKRIWASSSNKYSADLLEKSNFKCAYSMKYEDYKENGEVVFRLPHPHTDVKVMVQNLM